MPLALSSAHITYSGALLAQPPAGATVKVMLVCEPSVSAGGTWLPMSTQPLVPVEFVV